MTIKKAKTNGNGDDISEISIALQSVETVLGNEDLLAHILVRVPAKSLIKCKSVCKDWRSVITNSQFAFNQYTISRDVVSSIHFQEDSRVKTLSYCGDVNLLALPFSKEFHHPNQALLMHSCNGLDLFSAKRINLFVCNLITRQYASLPHNPYDKHGFGSHFWLAFDPIISPYYKVLQMKSGQMGPIYIYSSKNKSWKCVHGNGVCTSYKVAFMDGAIHWINESNNYFRFLIDEEKLISTQMPPKPKILKSYNIRYFGECSGNLILIQCRRRSLRFKVLEMKKGTCCWKVKYQVDLNPVTHLRLMDDHEYYLLGIVNESPTCDHILLLAIPDKLISYNLNKKTLHILREISLKEFLNIKNLIWLPELPFIETLLPVN